MDITLIKSHIAPVVESMGCELLDVECEVKRGDTHLTFFIANEAGITLDDCERVHRAIDPVLDELDPSKGAPYTLNVSSPGLDRPFKTLRDFERNYGKKVEVKLYDPYRGKKVYEGVLIEKAEHTVTVAVTVKAVDERIQFEDSKVVYVRPYVSFE
ncbi:MAG: ribosome maturation factor RimP [Firmicutes bacterium]|nr:ribosome maturation factor RimP [Bacillota bacterium]